MDIVVIEEQFDNFILSLEESLKKKEYPTGVFVFEHSLDYINKVLNFTKKELINPKSPYLKKNLFAMRRGLKMEKMLRVYYKKTPESLLTKAEREFLKLKNRNGKKTNIYHIR